MGLLAMMMPKLSFQKKNARKNEAPAVSTSDLLNLNPSSHKSGTRTATTDVAKEKTTVVIGPEAAADEALAQLDAAAAKVQAITRGHQTRTAVEEKAAEKAEAADKAEATEKAAKEEKAQAEVRAEPEAMAAAANPLAPLVGWVSAIFSPWEKEEEKAAKTAQTVQSAAHSTMVSHQVPCFVSNEAAQAAQAAQKKRAAKAEASLPGFLSNPPPEPKRSKNLLEAAVGWVSSIFIKEENPLAQWLPTSFVASSLPTKAEFEASLHLPDEERANLERSAAAGAEAARLAALDEIARANEEAAATAMQAAERGREARAAAAAAAEAAADVYIHEVVAGIVADAIELVMVAAPGEQGEAKAVKPGDTKPGLLTRLSSSLGIKKKPKKLSPAEADAEMPPPSSPALPTQKRTSSFSPIKIGKTREERDAEWYAKHKKRSKPADSPEDEQPLVKFGFKVSEGGDVRIDMKLVKA